MPELNRSSKSHARIWNKVGERVRRDFLMQAIAGTLPGVCIHRVSGLDSAIGTTTTPIWLGGGQYPYFDDARTVQIVSNNINDTYNGSGAWVLRLTGLDANHEMQMEDITLRGTTPVLTQGEYTHVYYATVLSGGSRNGAIGTISLTDKKDSNLLGIIVPPFNTMRNGVFTVPAHTNAYVLDFHFNVDSVQDVIVGIRYTTPAGEDSVWVVGYVDVTSGGHQHEILVAPFFLPPLTDIELTAEKAGGVTAFATADATVLLIDTAFEWESYLTQDETYSIQRPDEE